MRPLVGLAVLGALCVGGCSLLFDGKDLHGKGGNGGDDLGAPGDGGGGGDGGGDLGGGGGDLGGGVPACSAAPLSSLKFTVTKPTTAAPDPLYVAVADLDQDGNPDIVTANYTTANFSVLLGTGTGSFGLTSNSPLSTCSRPQIVVATDVTDDGLADVIVSCFDGAGPTAAVDVYVNQSTPGSLKLAAAKPVTLPTPLPAGLQFLAFGAFGGDAHLDLAMVDPNDNIVRIYTGDGSGAFTQTATAYSAGGNASWISAGNLNGDGIDDLVIYNGADDDLTMLLSQAGGVFSASTLAKGTMGGTLYFVTNPPSLLDINHDGLTDILVASGTSSPGTVERFLNGGTPTAPMFPAMPDDIGTGDLPGAQGFADFNCDGVTDIAVTTNGCDTTQGPCPGSTNEPPMLWVLPGHGTGYDPQISVSIPLGAYNLAIADFNKDGYADIVTGGFNGAVSVIMTTP